MTIFHRPQDRPNQCVLLTPRHPPAYKKKVLPQNAKNKPLPNPMTVVDDVKLRNAQFSPAGRTRRDKKVRLIQLFYNNKHTIVTGLGRARGLNGLAESDIVICIG